MTTALTITKVDETDPAALFRHYQNETHPQPCHLAIDLETGDVRCDYNPEIGNGIPKAVFDRRVRWYEIPVLTARAANRLLEDATPLAARILAGATVEWDGENNVGYLDEDAQAAEDELDEMCNPERWPDAEQVMEYEAADWFGEESGAETIKRIGLTADTSDTQLADLATAEEVAARSASDAGYTVLTGAEDYLTELREELREEHRATLAEVAEELESLTIRRDEMIRQQSAWGDSSRAIGERANLSHTRVQAIAKTEPAAAA